MITVSCKFPDGPKSSTVTASAVDSDGAVSNTASNTVSVQNVDPTATLNAPVSINEGGTATVGFANQQDGETDTNVGFHYAFDCNGGPLDGATYANSGTANSTTCAYDDNKARLEKGGFGSYTVRAKNMDKDGGSNEYTRQITVNNVAPTATFNSPASVNHGANFTLSLTGISEPSSADTNAGFTYAYDCGGGSGYVSAPTASTNCAATLDQPTMTVKGKVTDKDGGSNEYTANVNVNNVYPTGTIRINNNAATTNNPIVNLTLSATDPPPGSNVGQMRFRNENTQNWSVWEPYQTSRQWQLSDGDGPKTVFVEYKDNAGNVSQGTTSDNIELDTTTPPDTARPETNITSGPSGPTNDDTPTFTFSGSDNASAAGDLLFSYKVDDNAWSAPSSATSVTLPALNNGAHTFYVKAIDGAGNEADPPDERAFTVDTAAPMGSVVINANRATTTKLTVTLTLRASDTGGSGVPSMRIANTSGALASAGWQPYASSKGWRLSGGGSGTRTVYVQYRDGAGNLSGVVLDRIRYRR